MPYDRDGEDIALETLSPAEKSALHMFLKCSTQRERRGKSLEEHLLLSLTLSLRKATRLT